MKDRIAIPIKNYDGQLVGYAGRLVDDDAIDADTPKYRFPGDRTKGGTKFIFRKSELLYHPDELRGCKSKYLFLVEGFPSVWWFWQHRIRPVVAVMGASLSERQAELVCELTADDARIVLIPDGNDAGVRLAQSALALISPQRFVRWVRLADEKQPTDLPGDELAGILKSVLA
jgi:DNA primase